MKLVFISSEASAIWLEEYALSFALKHRLQHNDFLITASFFLFCLFLRVI